MENMILLNKKRDETIKAIMCGNESMQRAYISCEVGTSPTIASGAIINTGVINAKHKIDVTMIDIQKLFIKIEIALDRDNNIMNLRGNCVAHCVPRHV